MVHITIILVIQFFIYHRPPHTQISLCTMITEGRIVCLNDPLTLCRRWVNKEGGRGPLGRRHAQPQYKPPYLASEFVLCVLSIQTLDLQT